MVKSKQDMVKVTFVMLSVCIFCFYLGGCKRRSLQTSDSQSEPAVTVDITNEIPEIQVLEEFNEESKVLEEPEVESIELNSDSFTSPTSEQIQAALKSAGYYNGSIDGIMGPKSKKAILNFQRDNNLVADGKVGPKTWSKLKKHLD